MPLTWDICGADWKWLEARGHLQCSAPVCGGQAGRQTGGQADRPLSAAVDFDHVYQHARQPLCMNACFLVAPGRMGGCGGVGIVAGVLGGALGVCSVRGPWTCGSGSLKLGAKMLS